MTVRAFDGSKSVEVDLTLEIRPFQFEVSFIVVDILANSMLLGRSWINSAGAIPSSLTPEGETYQRRLAHHYYRRKENPYPLLFSHPIHRYVRDQRR